MSYTFPTSRIGASALPMAIPSPVRNILSLDSAKGGRDERSPWWCRWRQDAPRGFRSWTPKPETLELLDQVKGILKEYRAYLPPTCRQVFYRLVAAHGYEETEPAYKRLCHAKRGKTRPEAPVPSRRYRASLLVPVAPS